MNNTHYDDYEKTEVILNYEADKINYPKQKVKEEDLKTSLIVTKIKLNQDKNKTIAVVTTEDDFINKISAYKMMKFKNEQQNIIDIDDLQDLSYFVEYQKPKIENNELFLLINKADINKKINWEIPIINIQSEINYPKIKKTVLINNQKYKYVDKKTLENLPIYIINSDFTEIDVVQDKLIPVFNFNDFKIKTLAKYNSPVINKLDNAVVINHKFDNHKIIWEMPKLDYKKEIKYVEGKYPALASDLNYHYVNKMRLKKVSDLNNNLNKCSFDKAKPVAFKVKVPGEINLLVKENKFEINDSCKLVEINSLENLKKVKIETNNIKVSLLQLPDYNKKLVLDKINYQLSLNEIKAPDKLNTKLILGTYKLPEYKNKVIALDIDQSLKLTNKIKVDVNHEQVAVPDFNLNKIDDINVVIDFKETKLPEIYKQLMVDNLTRPIISKFKSNVNIQTAKQEIMCLNEMINSIVPVNKARTNYHEMTFAEPIDVFQYWMKGGI